MKSLLSIYQKNKELLLKTAADKQQVETLKCTGVFLAAMLIFTAIEYVFRCTIGDNSTFINPFMQALPFNLALAAPILLLGKLGRYYAAAVLFSAFLLCCCQLVSLQMFKAPIGGDLFDVITMTERQEIKEFANAFVNVWIVVTLVLLAALTIGAGIGIFCYKTFNSRMAAFVALALIAPFLINTVRITLIKKEDIAKVFDKHLISFMFYEYSLFNEGRHELAKSVFKPDIPHGLSRLPGQNPDKFWGVVIIGESHSRHHMSLYGYPRQTNPHLSAMRNELFVYTDVISSFAQTGPALKSALTAGRHCGSPVSCSVVNFCKATGFKTGFVCNQRMFGNFDNPVTMIFGSCDYVKYLNDVNQSVAGDDIRLVNELKNVLKADRTPAVLFLEVIGCHNQYKLRYPKEYAKFDGLYDEVNKHLSKDKGDLINEYDNAMLYSDYILSEIIKAVKNTRMPAFVLFFSDHAEALYEDGKTVFREAHTPCRYMYDIPFILWVSPEYRKMAPDFCAALGGNVDKPLQENKFIFAILDLMRVRYDGFPEDKDIFSPHYVPSQRIIARKDYDRLYKKKPCYLR